MVKTMEELKPDMARQLFKQRAWDPAEGDKITFNSLDFPSYAYIADGENSAVKNLRAVEGFTKTVEQEEIAARFNISNRFAKFAKEPLEQQMAKSLVQSSNNLLDLILTHRVLTYAENTTYIPRGKSVSIDWTCGDNQALASATHVVGSGDTYNNLYVPGAAQAYSTTSISQMIQQGQDTFKNNTGESTDFEPDTVVVANDINMIKKHFEMYETDLVPESANNAYNFYRGKMNLVVLKRGLVGVDGKTRLTTPTHRYRYSLVDSRYDDALQLCIAENPTVKLKDTDADTILKIAVSTMFASHAAVHGVGRMFHLTNVAIPVVAS